MDLYRGFAMIIENAPEVRALAAGLLDVDVADLDSPPLLDMHPTEARNWLVELIEESDDQDVLAMAGYLVGPRSRGHAVRVGAGVGRLSYDAPADRPSNHWRPIPELTRHPRCGGCSR